MMPAMLLAAALAAPLQRLQPLIAEAAVQSRLPAAWVTSVIAAESGGRTSGPHGGLRSPAGAMGVMQIMPHTWSDLAGSQVARLDPDRPRDNVMLGSAYLLSLYRRFGFPGAIAAYHAGPGTYRAYLTGRRALPSATRYYVTAVLGHLGARTVDADRSAPCGMVPPSPLFVRIGQPPPDACTGHLARRASGGLFISLREDTGGR